MQRPYTHIFFIKKIVGETSPTIFYFYCIIYFLSFFLEKPIPTLNSMNSKSLVVLRSVEMTKFLRLNYKPPVRSKPL